MLYDTNLTSKDGYKVLVVVLVVVVVRPSELIRGAVGIAHEAHL